MRSKGVWIFAEQSSGQLQRVSYELLNWGSKLAEKLGSPLSAVLLGSNIDNSAQELIYHGADQVYLVDDPHLEHFLVEPYAAILVAMIKKHMPEIIIGAATYNGRTLMPYVAHKVKAGLTADCTSLEIDPASGELLQTRPAIGGNIMATIKTHLARPQMATVRPRSMRPRSRNLSRRGEIIPQRFEEAIYCSRVKRIGFVAERSSEMILQDAEIVVAGGRGLKRADNFAIIRALASLLGAAEGASRAVVDYGWVPYSSQVGLSGKTVTPRLYLALGISGSVQHLAGMQTADNIIAVNTDPDAQIFKVADLGIVADLFEFIPKLIDRLKEMREDGEGDE